MTRCSQWSQGEGWHRVAIYPAAKGGETRKKGLSYCTSFVRWIQINQKCAGVARLSSEKTLKGSFCPSTETLRKQAGSSTTDSVRTLENSHRLSPTRWMLNQDKCRFAMEGRLWSGPIICLAQAPLCQAESVLERKASTPGMRPGSCSGRKRKRPHLWKIVYVCSKVCGKYTKKFARCLTLFCQTLKLGWENHEHLENATRWTKHLYISEAKYCHWVIQWNAWHLGGKAGRVWEIRTFKSILVCGGI